MQIGIRCLGMHRRGLRAAIPASEARPHANAAARNEPGLVFMFPAAEAGFESPAAVARTRNTMVLGVKRYPGVIRNVRAITWISEILAKATCRSLPARPPCARLRRRVCAPVLHASDGHVPFARSDPGITRRGAVALPCSGGTTLPREHPRRPANRV